MHSFIKRNQALLLSIFSGLLLAFSWPARGVPLLAFVALTPLLQIEDSFFRRRAETRAIRMFVHAWMAFFVFNLLTTWWIMYATLPGMLVAVLLNPVFMALPWLLMHLARRILPGNHGQTALVLLWLSFEYLHALWDLNWSWLDLGNVFASMPLLVQWYEFTGAAGGTAWILAVNLMLFTLWKYYKEHISRAYTWASHPSAKKAANALKASEPANNNHRAKSSLLFTRQILLRSALLTATLLIPLLISLVMWRQYEEPYDPVEVVIIQPSHDPYEHVESTDEAIQRVNIMTRLADSKITEKTRFVVAPEAANPLGIWTHDAENHFAVQLLRQHIVQHPGLIWILGSFSYRLYRPGEPRPASATSRMGSNYYDACNSAIMIEAGMPVVFHHKSKLVPGIERMPFYTVLKPIGRLVEKFGGTQSSLGTQKHHQVFHSEAGSVLAPAVCYESIYGDYMAKYIRNGAGLIFIVTNDGWWRNTPGHRQHNQYARLRAVEFRRSIARSASTGISSFINQKGEITKQTSWWETVAIAHELHQNYKITFFAMHGNYLGKLSVFLSALLLLYMISQRLIKKN